MNKIFLPSLLVVLGLPAPAIQADRFDTARDLHEHYQHAIVWIQAVVEVQGGGGRQGGGSREMTIEALGTFVDESGLIVTSYSSLDPAVLFRGQSWGGMEGGSETVFKEVKLIKIDGSEIPARVVLKDMDLDLAFIQPDVSSEAWQDFRFVTVDLDAKPELRVLDEVILMGKLDKFMDREPTVMVGQITAVVKKPRTFYAVTRAMPGTPVFDTARQLVGISVRRMVNGTPAMMVVLPAQDIKRIATQVKTPWRSEPAPAQ